MLVEVRCVEDRCFNRIASSCRLLTLTRLVKLCFHFWSFLQLFDPALLSVNCFSHILKFPGGRLFGKERKTIDDLKLQFCKQFELPVNRWWQFESIWLQRESRYDLGLMPLSLAVVRIECERGL